MREGISTTRQGTTGQTAGRQEEDSGDIQKEIDDQPHQCLMCHLNQSKEMGMKHLSLGKPSSRMDRLIGVAGMFNIKTNPLNLHLHLHRIAAGGHLPH